MSDVQCSTIRADVCRETAADETKKETQHRARAHDLERKTNIYKIVIMARERYRNNNERERESEREREREKEYLVPLKIYNARARVDDLYDG
jgi:transcription initiation factor TFIID subunit TAF12